MTAALFSFTFRGRPQWGDGVSFTPLKRENALLLSLETPEPAVGKLTAETKEPVGLVDEENVPTTPPPSSSESVLGKRARSPQPERASRNKRRLTERPLPFKCISCGQPARTKHFRCLYHNTVVFCEYCVSQRHHHKEMQDEHKGHNHSCLLVFIDNKAQLEARAMKPSADTNRKCWKCLEQIKGDCFRCNACEVFWCCKCDQESPHVPCTHSMIRIMSSY